MGLKVKYRQVNAKPDNRKPTFFYSTIIIDYFPFSKSRIWGVVEDVDFVAIYKCIYLSMYCHNLAAKALIEVNFEHAYSLLSAAMQLSSNNIKTFNTLSVLYKNSGNHALAESHL